MSTDVLISFDTTGSMYPCITEVRRKVKDALVQLFERIPDLRVGIITHGDYCDRNLCITEVGFTNSLPILVRFVETAPNTNGGDSDECYEFVLNHAQTFDWKADNKVFILIADAMPHRVGYRYDGKEYRLDWKAEAKALAEMGVCIYSVEALGNYNSSSFYEPLANLTNGKKLDLNQFGDVVEIIYAICYHKVEGRLEEYKTELETSFKMNRNLAAVFGTLGSETKKEVFTKADSSGLLPVPPYRFQLLHVDKACVIKDFVESSGARFLRGRGFYQFTKRELVQEHKEVILRNKMTGDMFTGAEARNFIGLPFGERGDINPKYFNDYEVFIQSTSLNRKLMPGTKFLYENSIM